MRLPDFREAGIEGGRDEARSDQLLFGDESQDGARIELLEEVHRGTAERGVDEIEEAPGVEGR